MNDSLNAKSTSEAAPGKPHVEAHELERDDEQHREEHPIHCPNCGLDTGARGWRYAYPTH